MKFNTYHCHEIMENHLDLYYNQIDAETSAIIEFINTFHNGIHGKNNKEKRTLYPHEIIYCESVDHKTFAYLNESVWQIDLNLQELITSYQRSGFVRISKSMVVNLYQIDHIESDLNMKMKLLLKNKEVIVVNRGYKKDFLRFLESFTKGGN